MTSFTTKKKNKFLKQIKTTHSILMAQNIDVILKMFNISQNAAAVRKVLTYHKRMLNSIAHALAFNTTTACLRFFHRQFFLKNQSILIERAHREFVHAHSHALFTRSSRLQMNTEYRHSTIIILYCILSILLFVHDSDCEAGQYSIRFPHVKWNIACHSIPFNYI